MNYILTLAGFSQSISISASQILLGVMIISSLWFIYKEGDFEIFKTRLFVCFCLLYVSIGLSLFFAETIPVLSKSAKSFWGMSYLFTAMLLVTDKEKLRLIMNSIVAGGAFAASYAIIQYFFFDTERAIGFMTHALTFGNSIVMIAVLCLFTITENRFESRSEKIFFYTALPLLIISLVLSGSRGPILALPMTAAILLIIKFRFKGLAYACLLGAAVIAVIVFTPSINERFSRIISDEYKVSSSSIGTRIVLWQTSLKIIRDNPVFGIGYGNFRKNVDKYNNKPLGSKAHAHNSFLQQAVSYGLTGLTVLMIFFGVLWQEIMKTVKRKIPYSYGVLAAFIAFLICGLTENNLGDSEVAMLMWLLSGSVIGIMFNGDSA